MEHVTVGSLKDMIPTLLLQGIPKVTSESEKVCSMAIDLYKRTLDMPSKESSELLRHLLSSK